MDSKNTAANIMSDEDFLKLRNYLDFLHSQGVYAVLFPVNKTTFITNSIEARFGPWTTGILCNVQIHFA